MLRLTYLVLPLALLASQSASAAGQSLYKCRIDGKLTYSGSPCKGAPSTAIPVPEAPPAPANLEQNIKRQKTESAKLQKERESREAVAQGDQATDARLAEMRRQRCATAAAALTGTTTPATLAADAAKQSIEEKVERAADEEKARVRREAERTAGNLAEEC